MRKDTRASGRLIREAVAAREVALEAEGWMFPQELRLEGHLPLVPGRRFQIRGRRGWWRFSGAAIDPEGHISVYCSGPYTKAQTTHTEMSRAFALKDEGPAVEVYGRDIRVEVRRVERSRG